ncbi:MAG: hypothetical protein N3F10_06100 [Candidatus Bathyarchaeota archaeon]|nr:hypothetical protein [Candidatus Bathyarchaeota archaeon]
MSFEIQELSDVIKVVVLLALREKPQMRKSLLKKRIDRVHGKSVHIEAQDLEEAVKELASEGLILDGGETIRLTAEGKKLAKEWENLLLKKDPILEIVAGLVDGSITGLVVVLSALAGGLAFKAVTFAALLTLTAVAITNFSSFLLGGITEDLADMKSLQTLMNFSLSDIPDRDKRDKSLRLLKNLFIVLSREVSRANLHAALVCSATTFLAGSIPITAYLILPEPLNALTALSIVGAVAGVFLVRYRSRKMKVHWKITLIETVAIVTIAVLTSLLLGGIA